jgi:hypothetical protein
MVVRYYKGTGLSSKIAEKQKIFEKILKKCLKSALTKRLTDDNEGNVGFHQGAHKA